MNIGETFTGTVHNLSSGGLGVCTHPSGRTVFVSGAWLGESGQFEIQRLKGWVGFANVVTLTVRSPHRVTPICSSHGYGTNHCGGCGWMFVDYDAQLSAKQQRVEATLKRVLTETTSSEPAKRSRQWLECIEPIWPSPNSLGYRNRAQLKTDGQRLGYLGLKSNNLVDVEQCLILSPSNQETLSALREKLPNTAWRPREPSKHSRRHAKTSSNSTGNSTQIRGFNAPARPGHSHHKKRKTPWTTLDIDEDTDSNNVQINRRLPFRQANSAQNERMQIWLAERLQTIRLASQSTLKVLELFCGSGNFTEIIAKAGFDNIIAVECIAQALQTLEKKQLHNVSPTLCDLYNNNAFTTLMQTHHDADVLILDPPRDGLKTIDCLFSHEAKPNPHQDVLYISCNLATFSRDLATFIEAGFSVQQIQPLDQFPQTPHIELLCHLSN
ncbi:MAG: hypothetical protein P8J26_08520 [Pseudomonadales bacterium]|nr:hypothetical protein [Pseudomonadales bacterium]